MNVIDLTMDDEPAVAAPVPAPEPVVAVHALAAPVPGAAPAVDLDAAVAWCATRRARLAGEAHEHLQAADCRHQQTSSACAARASARPPSRLHPRPSRAHRRCHRTALRRLLRPPTCRCRTAGPRTWANMPGRAPRALYVREGAWLGPGDAGPRTAGCPAALLPCRAVRSGEEHLLERRALAAGSTLLLRVACRRPGLE
jgi:hypothetical protein